jgi:hypothetical protein
MPQLQFHGPGTDHYQKIFNARNDIRNAVELDSCRGALTDEHEHDCVLIDSGAPDN